MPTAERLLAWFRANARDLPWRWEPRDPYRVLVSELMLQQTQVDRVVPRFARFLERFPDLDALAEASEEEVLAAWSGLGYYRRARLLHRLARQVVAAGGELPAAPADLRRLPGVGPYTAAAVASLAFGAAEPAVDGNVIRVASRVLASTKDGRTAAGRREVERWVSSLYPDGAPGPINEALIELGATVCLAVAPRCSACPLAPECRASAEGRPEAYPAPRRRRGPVRLTWVAACCVDRTGRWLLRRVDEGPILRGLWLPPLAELVDGESPADRARTLVPLPLAAPPMQLEAVRHAITHRRIQVLPVLLRVAAGQGRVGGRWVDPDDLRLPTSSLLEKLLKKSALCSSVDG